MDILDIIASAHAPTPSGTVGRVMAESIMRALSAEGLVITAYCGPTAKVVDLPPVMVSEPVDKVSPTEAVTTELAPANTDRELNLPARPDGIVWPLSFEVRIARIEKHLGL